MKTSLAPFACAGALLAALAPFAAIAQGSSPSAPAARASGKPAKADVKPETKAAASAAAPKPAAPASGEAPQPRLLRSEVSTHEFWTVSCDHFEAPTPARCLARLPVFRSNELKQVLVVLSIGKGAGDQWALNLHVPTNIALPTGAEIRFGDKPARKITFQSCEPALCAASVPLDAALRAELTGAANAKASWVSLVTGDISAEFPLRGSAQALAALK